jgi:predicted nucleic acid-binding protein
VIVYLDTSVILRIVLNEPNELHSWEEITHGVTSELSIVECHRVLYRLNASGRLSDSAFQLARNYADQILLRLTIVNITPELLEKAAGPCRVLSARSMRFILYLRSNSETAWLMMSRLLDSELTIAH